MKISSKNATVEASLKWNGQKISKVESIKVTVNGNGKSKTYTLKSGQYKIKVKNASKRTVKITGKGDFTGTVTVKTSGSSNTGS